MLNYILQFAIPVMTVSVVIFMILIFIYFIRTTSKNDIHEAKEEQRHSEAREILSDVSLNVSEIKTIVSNMNNVRYGNINVTVNIGAALKSSLDKIGLKGLSEQKIAGKGSIFFVGMMYKAQPVGFFISQQDGIDELIISSFTYIIPSEARHVIQVASEKTRNNILGHLNYEEYPKGVLLKFDQTIHSSLITADMMKKYMTVLANCHIELKEILDEQKIQYTAVRGAELVNYLN